MKKTYIAIAISLVTGFAAAAIMLKVSEPQPIVTPDAYFDASAATADRLRALEVAVAEERNARLLLEEELLSLFAEIEALGDDDPAQSEQPERITEAGPSATGPDADVFRLRRARLSSREARTTALIDAGFSPARAEWIMQREDELAVEAMQARFEAQRAGDVQAMFTARTTGDSMLRAELGDAEYEQYLEASGRATTVTVGSVLESSPGQRAGLETGDEIVRYDGRRVFSYSDINNLQLEGEAGEPVTVDILRDDMPMQLVLPRGPIGIQASRSRRRSGG